MFLMRYYERFGSVPYFGARAELAGEDGSWVYVGVKMSGDDELPAFISHHAAVFGRRNRIKPLFVKELSRISWSSDGDFWAEHLELYDDVQAAGLGLIIADMPRADRMDLAVGCILKSSGNTYLYCGEHRKRWILADDGSAGLPDGAIELCRGLWIVEPFSVRVSARGDWRRAKRLQSIAARVMKEGSVVITQGQRWLVLEKKLSELRLLGVDDQDRYNQITWPSDLCRLIRHPSSQTIALVRSQAP